MSPLEGEVSLLPAVLRSGRDHKKYVVVVEVCDVIQPEVFHFHKLPVPHLVH